MTRYLLAVGSVHDAAAACDYLEDRIDADDDVIVVPVTDDRERDAADATNVLRVRLPSTRVETFRAEGNYPESVLDAVRAVDADCIVLGRDAEPESSDGSARDRIREAADCDVVRPGD